MGWLKIRSADLLSTLAIFDAIAPQWRFANDDHALRRSTLITSHLDNRDTEIELWICVADQLDADNLQATLPFEDFGHAIWDEERQVRNCYHYTGNSTTPIPGYVIAH